VGESADCPAYAGTLLSIARESLEDAKYCFRGGRYRVSLMSAQHALELAAKALLCGCCLATKEELREEVGHRLIAAAKLAWKKLQERLALVEKIINMCPDLCALLKAA
jgi:HEPN domain-containing protein